MIQRLDVYDFRDAFHRMGRGDTFSYKGYEVLFSWLTELDQGLELDVISLCCDFAEIHHDEIKRETGCENIEELRDRTLVLYVDNNTIIYQVF